MATGHPPAGVPAGICRSDTRLSAARTMLAPSLSAEVSCKEEDFGSECAIGRAPADHGCDLPPICANKQTFSTDLSSSESILVPPATPPPIPYCPSCACRPSSSAGEESGAVAAASAQVAEAARMAMVSAFAELQPLLLRELAAALAQLAEAAAARPARSKSPCVSLVSNAERRSAPDTCMRPRTFDAEPLFSEKSPSELSAKIVPSIRSDLSKPSGVSKMSLMSPRSSQVFFTSQQSGVRPTVQSLETDIAQSTLRQFGGFGVVKSGAPRRRGIPPTQRGESAGSASSTSVCSRAIRVVPEPDEQESLDSEPGAAAEAVESDEAGAKGWLWWRPSFCARAASPRSDTEIGHRKPSPAHTAMHTTKSDGSRFMSGAQVLKERCNELAYEATQNSLPAFDMESNEEQPNLGSEPCSEERAAPTVLRVCGILPWDTAKHPWVSAVYLWYVRAVVALCVATFFLPSLGNFAPSFLRSDFFLADCAAHGVMCWHRKGFLSQVPLAIGAVLVLLLVSLRQHQEALEDTLKLLRGVSHERRYESWRTRKARWDKAFFAVLWVAIASTNGFCTYFGRRGDLEFSGLQVVLFVSLIAVFSGVILCLAYGVVLVCRSLSMMIDAFCCDIVTQTSPQEVAHVWNLTQAVLRKASVSVENGLLVLCIILATMVPLLLIDGIMGGGASPPLPTLLPGILVTCGIIYMLLLAATISEQCTRVPALVNAISFGEGTEIARGQTVDYISNSAAGFYVFGTRLTLAMVVKYMYFWCIVVVGLITRLGFDVS